MQVEFIFLFLIYNLLWIKTGDQKIAPGRFPPTNSSWIRVTVWVRVRVVGYIPGNNLSGSNFPSTIKTTGFQPIRKQAIF